MPYIKIDAIDAVIAELSTLFPIRSSNSKTPRLATTGRARTIFNSRRAAYRVRITS